MSKQLAMASGLSVLLMAAFVVFAPHAARQGSVVDGGKGLFGIEASARIAR